MDVLQTWLLVGVPGLVIVGGLFVGRSRVRAWLGYGVLLAIVATFAFVARDVLSAALVGLLIVVFVATGRGTNLDARYAEHHQTRRRLTTHPSEL